MRHRLDGDRREVAWAGGGGVSAQVASVAAAPQDDQGLGGQLDLGVGSGLADRQIAGDIGEDDAGAGGSGHAADPGHARRLPRDRQAGALMAIFSPVTVTCCRPPGSGDPPPWPRSSSMPMPVR
jgi:hypothetical protein